MYAAVFIHHRRASHFAVPYARHRMMYYADSTPLLLPTRLYTSTIVIQNNLSFIITLCANSECRTRPCS